MDVIKTSDLAPGNPCPVCGNGIKTWREVQKVDEAANGAGCGIDAELIEQDGLGGGLSCDYVVVNHV